MKDKVKVEVNGGLGLTTLLTVLFVALKLTKVITWSWWWVLSPTLISIGFGLILLIIFIVYLLFSKIK